ncbi:MAG TPA: hypothetical protein VGF69_25140 [Thermoanaerobaculia bacterium]|jgi:hypothetical protein
MSGADRAVLSLQRRLYSVLFLRRFLAFSTAWCVLWGAGVLLLRRGLTEVPFPPLCGAAGLPLVAVAAWLLARRERPSRDAVLALLDARARCGGLLMASTVDGAAAWEPNVQTIPRVRWRARRASIAAVAAVLFVIATLYVPARAAERTQKLDVSAEVEQLDKRVELLKEEQVLPAEQAATMENALEDVRKNTAGDDPAKAWEVLDSVDEATLRAAEEAAAAAVQKAEGLTRVEAMATALATPGLDESRVAAGMKDLAGDAEAQALLQNLSPELRKALAENAISASDLQKLASAAKQGKAALKAQLERLAAAKVIDPKALSKLADASKLGNRSELEEFLRDNSSPPKLSDAVGEFRRGGKAGVSRGRGDAPMFFGDESDVDGNFREITLPSADVASLQASDVVGISAFAPSPQATGRSTGGALSAGKDGGSAFTAVVLPRHRGTVERYFERKKK